MVIKVKGVIKFEPVNITKKHIAQDWKKVAMIKLNCDTENYYAWFIRKRFNVNLLKTIRGSHVTIISDIMDSKLFEKAKKLFDKKEITLYYDIEPRTDGKHWWLRVYCPEAEGIRTAIGLTKTPYFGFHLTLGYVDEKYLPHSKYIFNVIKFHKLLTNDNRIPLEEHKIVEFS